MLNKREKKSYGAYNDYFLEQCEEVDKPYEVTHVHIKDFAGAIPGIYRYEPKTGMLSLDGEHIGIMKFQAAVKAKLDKGRVVFLRHPETWNEMIDEGIIKEDEKIDAIKMMNAMGLQPKQTGRSIKQVNLQKVTPPAPTKKTGGFLSLFNKKK